jgi:hypothetical protein
MKVCRLALEAAKEGSEMKENENHNRDVKYVGMYTMGGSTVEASGTGKRNRIVWCCWRQRAEKWCVTSWGRRKSWWANCSFVGTIVHESNRVLYPSTTVWQVAKTLRSRYWDQAEDVVVGCGQLEAGLECQIDAQRFLGPASQNMGHRLRFPPSQRRNHLHYHGLFACTS